MIQHKTSIQTIIQLVSGKPTLDVRDVIREPIILVVLLQVLQAVVHELVLRIRIQLRTVKAPSVRQQNHTLFYILQSRSALLVHSRSDELENWLHVWGKLSTLSSFLAQTVENAEKSINHTVFNLFREGKIDSAHHDCSLTELNDHIHDF